MPCNSDYMEPTAKERQLQHTAALIVRFGKQLNINVTRLHIHESKNVYCSQDYVSQLCDALTTLRPTARDRLLYSDAKDKKIRKLAEWWEQHEEADRKRLEAEQAKRIAQKTKAEALAKLSPAERKVLGV